MKNIKQFTGEHRWLSNFYPCKVFLDGEIYDSVENAYQAAKTLDLEKRKEFKTITPGQAKRLGKTLTIREDWDNVKLDVMSELLRQKFKQPLFYKLLIDTGIHCQLEEGNTWNDTYWGVNLNTGKGENNLGKLIMYIRTEKYFDIMLSYR